MQRVGDGAFLVWQRHQMMSRASWPKWSSVPGSSAWQQMVRQAPAATLADGHGVQRGTAARHAKIAGADYASSADHGHHGPAAG